VVQEFLAKKRIKLLSHPPYSPDLAPADYFLFPQLKKDLAGITMTQEEFKKDWEGVLRGVRGRSSRRPSCGSTSGEKNLFASTEAMSRNRKKINFLLLSLFTFY
jgi:hypothetical protein